MSSVEKQRPGWDEYFLSIAEVVSSRSPCLRANWGALLVDEDRRVIAFGYNGPPAGARHCEDRGCVREEQGVPSGSQVEKCMAIHAEQNALIQAPRERTVESIMYLCGVDPRDGSYCRTCGPCILCAKQLIQAGVSEVIVKVGPEGTSPFSVTPRKALSTRAGQLDLPSPFVERLEDPPGRRSNDPGIPDLWRSVRST